MDEIPLGTHNFICLQTTSLFLQRYTGPFTQRFARPFKDPIVELLQRLSTESLVGLAVTRDGIHDRKTWWLHGYNWVICAAFLLLKVLVSTSELYGFSVLKPLHGHINLASQYRVCIPSLTDTLISRKLACWDICVKLKSVSYSPGQVYLLMLTSSSISSSVLSIVSGK